MILALATFVYAAQRFIEVAGWDEWEVLRSTIVDLNEYVSARTPFGELLAEMASKDDDALLVKMCRDGLRFASEELAWQVKATYF